MTSRAWAILAVLLVAGCVDDPSEEDDVASPAQLSCGTPCSVTIATGRLWEPMVAVDPLDPLHIVVSVQQKSTDATTGERGSWAFSHVSRDGGLTWHAHRLPGGRDAPPTHPMAATIWIDDSVPMFLADGSLMWTIVAFEGVNRMPAVLGGADLFALRSTDGGATFPEVRLVGEGSGSEVYLPHPTGGSIGQGATIGHDKQWSTLGPDGTILLAWTTNYDNRPDACGGDDECSRLVFSTSRDGVQWSPAGLVVERVISGAFPLILGDGTWLVSYHDTDEQQVAVARSTDKGATWSTEALDASTKFPVMARSAGPDGERVYMAYPRGEDDRDGAQTVVVRWSNDSGATWSQALTLDVPEAPGRTIPAIAPGPGGAAYVTYWSPTPTGGEHYAVRVVPGNASAPLLLGTHEGPMDITGDYMGVAPLPDGSAFAVWTASEGDAMKLVGSIIRYE